MSALNDLLDMDVLWTLGSDTYYPLSGSFCDFLIKEYAYDKLLELIDKKNYKNSTKRIKSVYTSVYGQELKTDHEKWQLFLETY